MHKPSRPQSIHRLGDSQSIFCAYVLRPFWWICTCIGLTLASNSGIAAPRVPIVTTFSILSDLVEAVGGDRVAVTSLVGRQSEVHAYQPRPSDAKLIAAATLVFLNGYGLEGWLPRLIRATAAENKTVMAASNIPSQHLLKPDGHTVDPHIWHNPLLVRFYVRTICEALIRVDPDGAPIYRQHAARLDQQLVQMDQWATQQFAPIAPEKRRAIVAHDAFAYLGARYHVQFLAPQGMSSAAEATPQTVAKLILQIRRERIHALFIEPMRDHKLLDQIARETKTNIRGPLFADTLSTRDGPVPHYIDLLRHNINALVNGIHAH